MEDIELSVLESFQDYLPETNSEDIVITSMIRQGAAEMAELVLDWAPAGVEVESDED